MILQLVVEFHAVAAHTKQQIYNRIKNLRKWKADPILEKNTAIARFSKANKKLASQNPNAVIRNPIVELRAVACLGAAESKSNG